MTLMHIARPHLFSKLDAAIQLLQHLAAAAVQDGDGCADALFQAADFLQDTQDVADALEQPEMSGNDDLPAFEILMNSLATVLPGEDRLLHAA